ncbi:PREDICTED: uncharacterized protein LOC108549250 [Eufriesea mexicana]|uniref:uncharacterized protein LOC108549250 n=1 Tax=Eufriesea mexicana TaxID=516756 RepID=UPI00083C4A58|nr:PREDICTED: uncharacterized protein LOC108549250 [Eufriesea mexicana]
MPSFWFLDTLALHALRYKQDLDEYYMGVLVSWLAGEIRLLRDRKHTRKEFFKEMKDIFNAATNKVSEQKRLPYWNEIVSLYDRDTQEEMEEKLSTRNQSMESIREPSSREAFKFSSNIDPIFVLDIVIEATYSMYANELRYALVYAVFVEPIEVQVYDLPFAIRTPRQVKLADPKMVPFNIELQKSLRKNEIAEKFKKSHKTVKKNFEVPMTPPPSLDDERMLTRSRLFILPLIEAKEATKLFETDDA